MIEVSGAGGGGGGGGGGGVVDVVVGVGAGAGVVGCSFSGVSGVAPFDPDPFVFDEPPFGVPVSVGSSRVSLSSSSRSESRSMRDGGAEHAAHATERSPKRRTEVRTESLSARRVPSGDPMVLR